MFLASEEWMNQKGTLDKLEKLAPPCGVTDVPQAEWGLVTGWHGSRETTRTATLSPRFLHRTLASMALDTAPNLGEGRGQVGCLVRPPGSGLPPGTRGRSQGPQSPSQAPGVSPGRGEAGAETTGHTDPEGEAGGH